MNQELELLRNELAQIGSINLGELYITMPEARRYPLKTEIITRACPICGSELAIERYKRPMMMSWETAVKTWPTLPEEKRLYCPVCGSLLRWIISEQGYYEGYIKGLEALVITSKPWRVPYNVTWHSITCPSCGEVFEYASMLGKHGIELKCPSCDHSLGRKEGYFGAIRKIGEVKALLERRPTWTPVECPECGTTFEYRSFFYPYGANLVCPTCGHNFGAKAGYVGEEWDIRNIVKKAKPVEEEKPVPVTKLVEEEIPVPVELPEEKKMPWGTLIVASVFSVPFVVAIASKLKKPKVKRVEKPRSIGMLSHF